MSCAWCEYLSILPHRIRSEVDRLGRDILLETRLRLHQYPMLITTKGVLVLDNRVTDQDLHYTINAASEYSPWSAATISEGFITACGGHRIGICGSAVVSNGIMTSIRSIYSVSIRVAREFSGVSEQLYMVDGSMLIIGGPGSGKTTLLRDVIYQKSQRTECCISVVDERQELFPYIKNVPIFDPGRNTDVLSGCPKKSGISFLLRNMTPNVIALDEITHQDDCNALVQAAWCGVKLVATAHADSKEDFYRRCVYKQLIDQAIFQYLVIMRRDKTWYFERVQ